MGALLVVASELGYLNIPMGTSFGYYGSMTRDAVGRYQNTLAVTPASGYFGGLTKVAMYNDFTNHGWISLLGWNNPANY